MKIISGKITEIGNQLISLKSTAYSNVVVVNESGDRLRISNLVCDDGTDNRVFLGNDVAFHLLQTRAPIRKWNILVAVEDTAGLTVARSPGVRALVGSIILGLLSVFTVIGTWLLVMPFAVGLFLTLGLPTLRLYAAIRRFSPTSPNAKVSRIIEV
jgi:hypothetical protein